MYRKVFSYEKEEMSLIRTIYKKCVVCNKDIFINKKSMKKKYCDVCRVIVWNRQKKKLDYKRKLNHISDRILFCRMCRKKLPRFSHIDKKFCSVCDGINRKKRQHEWYVRKVGVNHVD